MKIAARVGSLLDEGAFAVLQKARKLEAEGLSVIHLEIGEPDFDTPGNIIDAAKKALDEGWTHYGPTPGYPQLREVIARHVSETRGVDVAPERVIVVPGGKPIIFFSILALAEPGDEVIYPNPGFPMYESTAAFAGAKPVPVPLVEERGFSFDLDVLRAKINERTKMIVLNSPHNPTGGVIPKEDLKEIAGLAIEHDVVVLSDEIYSRIWYDEEPASIYSLPGMAERTILLDGFSKTYAMTGWRLGYGVMPEWLVPAVTKLLVNSVSCTSSFTQMAGACALTGPQHEVEHMVAEFKRRRDFFVDGLNQIPGFRCVTPQGAFYAFPNITGTGMNSRDLASKLLTEAGVACLSGTDFGAYGEGYLRFSYVSSMENLSEALKRVRDWVESR
jgi:aspartate/methionine/tyrosine aminotransferase